MCNANNTVHKDRAIHLVSSAKAKHLLLDQVELVIKRNQAHLDDPFAVVPRAV